ncbi:MAG: RnfABCDGE type electron transport complex subunit B [Burkholderiales bacterium]
MDKEQLALQIDALLPQTQCRRCGYQGCMPYATAIAHDAADINQCPPGGNEGIASLARLLNRVPKPLNPANGAIATAALAFIDEASCIGCVRCIDACPVDAIIGAPKRMHTVISFECTGCELCVPACPVDCIDMIPMGSATQDESAHDRPNAAGRARRRYYARLARKERESSEIEALRSHRLGVQENGQRDRKSDAVKAGLAQALQRARAKKAEIVR